MAHFIGTTKGMKGEASRLGSAKSGMKVTCNGWNSGIAVYASIDAMGSDQFKVYKTSGSNQSESDELIYTHTEPEVEDENI